MVLMRLGHVREFRYATPSVHTPVPGYEFLPDLNLHHFRADVNIHPLAYIVMGNGVQGLFMGVIYITTHFSFFAFDTLSLP